MSTTVTLKRPVNHEGVSYERIEIDEPSIGALEAFEDAKASGRSETSAMIEMLAVDCGWPGDAIRKIKVGDMTTISEAMAPFVPDSDKSPGPSGDPSAPTSPTS